MAMNSDALGLAVASVIINKSTVPPSPKMIANIQQFWKDVSKEFVDHIETNAEVPSGISLNAGPYSGSTTGKGKVV